MRPYYRDDWLTVYHGDSRAVMAEMPAESVHCVVTSPPYWGLRDYGTASWLGGDEDCDHKPDRQKRNDRPAGAFHGGSDEGNGSREPTYKDVCLDCGAVRQDSQLGLEPTPEAYVANMVAVFREVRRVLRSDGTVWLNLGDSYANTGFGGTAETNGGFTGAAMRRDAGYAAAVSPRKAIPAGLKPKDLVGIPWRVAFALQSDGWYLRSDIIWSKPNPMPESVTDRPTKSHEYLFLLSKSPRYYFDADAVREGAYRADTSPQSEGRGKRGNGSSGAYEMPSRIREDFDGRRNIRSVWTIATAPYPGAHFATFPPKLVEPCIKAGTSERGVCPECGKHWRRVTERTVPTLEDRRGPKHRDKEKDALRRSSFHVAGWREAEPDVVRTLSWMRSCNHGHDPVPATVVDPFAGSGTTGMVAQSLSRRAVLIDLSMDYLVQLMERNTDVPLGL